VLILGTAASTGFRLNANGFCRYSVVRTLRNRRQFAKLSMDLMYTTLGKLLNLFFNDRSSARS
jgi:hypothetical protein